MKYDRVGVYRGYRLDDGEFDWQHVGDFTPREVYLPAEYERLTIVIENSTGEHESIAIEVKGTT